MTNVMPICYRYVLYFTYIQFEAKGELMVYFASICNLEALKLMIRHPTSNVSNICRPQKFTVSLTLGRSCLNSGYYLSDAVS